jgi:pimeloyl-ACP methyl ester carboxylesterase
MKSPMDSKKINEEKEMSIFSKKLLSSVFKSEGGRQRIIDHYDKLLSLHDFEYRERYVDTSFGSTYILESGRDDQPPLFLFHGSSSNSAAWFADIKALSQHFHVLAVDLIGDAGHSAETRPDTTSNGYSMWIRELYEGLGIEKASIMGNSLGGWMCLWFASVFPEKVDKIVLLATSGIAPIRVSFIFKVMFYGMRGGKGGDGITRMVFGKDSVPPEVIEFLNIISENYLPYTGALPSLSKAQLTKLVMPVLYIAGEDDKLTNVPKCANRLRKHLAQPTIYIIKNTGHVIYNVLDRVIPFLQKDRM